jgi:cell division protein FtsN
MPTDYKSYVRRPESGQARRSERPSGRGDAHVPAWAWFAGGLLLGIVVMGVMWLQDHQQITQAMEAQLRSGEVQQQQQGGTEPAAEDAMPQHQFEFYSVLPDMEVEVQPDSLRPAAPKPAAAAEDAVAAAPAEQKPQAGQQPAANGDADSHYLIQLASFRARADAERMLAGKALEGIPARIEKVTINDKAYYRLRSGPYSRDQAYSLHKRLKKSGIEILIMRVKG